LSTVVVRNGYSWILRPSLGRFTVYLDGHKRGVAELGGAIEIPVEPEQSHTVRVRLWWYLSPPVRLRLRAGETLVLTADRRRDLGFLKGILLMALRPFSSLYLGERSSSMP